MPWRDRLVTPPQVLRKLSETPDVPASERAVSSPRRGSSRRSFAGIQPQAGAEASGPFRPFPRFGPGISVQGTRTTRGGAIAVGGHLRGGVGGEGGDGGAPVAAHLPDHGGREGHSICSVRP